MNRKATIRDVKCAKDVPIVALDVFASTVQIWDLQSVRPLNHFEIALDLHRLELSHDGSICYAASWASGQNGGVAAYSALSGRKLWHRTDLRETQSLSVNADDNAIWCVSDAGVARLLSARDGQELDRISRVSHITEYRSDDLYQVTCSSERVVFLSHGVKRTRLFINEFLACAFAPAFVCLGEMSGGMRCFQLTGEELWTFTPPSTSHFTDIAFSAATGAVYAILFDWTDATSTLVAFDPADGSHVILGTFSSTAQAFSTASSTLVTSRGDVIGLHDGTIVSTIRLPHE